MIECSSCIRGERNNHASERATSPRAGVGSSGGRAVGAAYSLHPYDCNGNGRMSKVLVGLHGSLARDNR